MALKYVVKVDIPINFFPRTFPLHRFQQLGGQRRVRTIIYRNAFPFCLVGLNIVEYRRSSNVRRIFVTTGSNYFQADPVSCLQQRNQVKCHEFTT